VAPEQVDDAWPVVETWIADALERSGGVYLPEDIKDACERNAMQLWLVTDEGDIRAVVVTAVIDYPRKKVCQILICTGEGRGQWQEMIGLLEQWARDNGCDIFRPVARTGWARVLKPFGYRQTHVILEKDL
jgi:hypothetical protein